MMFMSTMWEIGSHDKRVVKTDVLHISVSKIKKFKDIQWDSSNLPAHSNIGPFFSLIGQVLSANIIWPSITFN